MELIDGNAISKEVLSEVREAVAQLDGKPKIVFVRVGEDPASVVYVGKKQKVAEEVGILSELVTFPDTVDRETLLGKIDLLNADPDVHGILVQSPLPGHLSDIEAFNRVDPKKDVDGFSTLNVGKLCQGDDTGFISCTPAGIIEILKRSSVETAGKHITVIGRSLIVGKPTGLLLLRKCLGGDATVTVCHSRTQDLAEHVKRADIIIAAIGRAQFITEDMVRPGAVVIDVGMNRIKDASRKSGYRLVGDVDFERVAPKASKITPVPRGVGPMTVAMLMVNTLKAYNIQQKDTRGNNEPLEDGVIAAEAEKEIKPAKMWQRGLAFFMDVLLILLFSLGLFQNYFLPEYYPDALGSFMQKVEQASIAGESLDPIMLSSQEQEMLAYVQGLLILFIWLYFSASEIFMKGGSLGKKVFRIRVISLQRAEPLRFFEVFLRSGIKAICLMTYTPLLINYLIAFITKKRQAGHDFLCKSIVAQE